MIKSTNYFFYSFIRGCTYNCYEDEEKYLSNDKTKCVESCVDGFNKVSS